MINTQHFAGLNRSKISRARAVLGKVLCKFEAACQKHWNHLNTQPTLAAASYCQQRTAGINQKVDSEVSAKLTHE